MNQPKPIMKKIFITFLGSLFVLGFAYAQGQHMYETIYLTPKLDKISELNTNLSAHNKKFHGEGEYYAYVLSVLTGNHTGDYVWVMGPGNFARLDSRPAENDGHDNDWNNNIMPLLSKMSQAEYWVRDSEQFYSSENTSGNKGRVRFYKVKTGKNQKFAEMFAKIVDVYKSKGFDRSVSLYWNSFPTAYGRNAATVSGIPSWAIYDEPGTFVADFESVHGEGTWEPWITEWRGLYDWMGNEIRETLPALSGAEN